ncbi:hypothetical protein RvY_07120 [Ramazzottius varieornatus]|uniref:Uncharacterized protein n=1 Tax=Ramazzottius varieornatus TaxID=947166 RepID=A0A1D1V770_RAMVA|nr:hypothetical protein RvY_07120 [Ramazzottius varieornatus]
MSRCHIASCIIFVAAAGLAGGQNTLTLDPFSPVPIGEFQSTDQQENFANYWSSLVFEFKDVFKAKGFAMKDFRGKRVIHTFSVAPDKNSTFLHEVRINGTVYKQSIEFQLGVESSGVFRDITFKYRYYFVPGEGLHVDYNIPPENPMTLAYVYAPEPHLDGDGLILFYKIGDITARRWYKRTTSSNPAGPPATSTGSSASSSKSL